MLVISPDLVVRFAGGEVCVQTLGNGEELAFPSP
jgi:hypothetical protein